MRWHQQAIAEAGIEKNSDDQNDEQDTEARLMTRGRFIAGAVCPECREMDKILLRATPVGDERECVACGFTDQVRDLTEQPTHLALLPAGKLDAIATERKPTQRGEHEDAQPVRFVTPKPPEPAPDSEA